MTKKLIKCHTKFAVLKTQQAMTLTWIMVPHVSEISDDISKTQSIHPHLSNF